jgi:hypothetical protein
VLYSYLLSITVLLYTYASSIINNIGGMPDMSALAGMMGGAGGGAGNAASRRAPAAAAQDDEDVCINLSALCIYPYHVSIRSVIFYQKY